MPRFILMILQTPTTVELGPKNAALHANIGYIAALIFSAADDSFNSFILGLDSFSLLVALTVSSKWSSSTLDRGAVVACLLISLVQGWKWRTGLQWKHEIRNGILRRDTIYRFGNCLLACCFGLVGRTLTAIQLNEVRQQFQ